MLDVEFLLTSDAELPLKVFYAYNQRSKALQPVLKSRIEHAAHAKGLILIEQSKSAMADFAFSPGLFDISFAAQSFIIADSGHFESKERPALLHSFLYEEAQPRLLMVPRGSIDLAALLKVPDVVVVQEPDVSETTILPILRYLQTTSRLYDYSRLTNEQEFASQLTKVVKQSRFTLLEFVSFFNEATLLYIDTATDTFDGSALRLRTEVRFGQLSLRQRLAAFLAQGDSWSLKALLVEIDRRHCTMRSPAATVVRELQRSTGRLLDAQRTSPAAAVYWTTLLLGWERQLLQGPFAFAFQKLCQTYRQARAGGFGGSPLNDVWGALINELVAAPTEPDNESPKQVLIDQLLVLLVPHARPDQPIWMNHLCAVAVQVAARRSRDVEKDARP